MDSTNGQRPKALRAKFQRRVKTLLESGGKGLDKWGHLIWSRLVKGEITTSKVNNNSAKNIPSFKGVFLGPSTSYNEDLEKILARSPKPHERSRKLLPPLLARLQEGLVTLCCWLWLGFTPAG